MKTIDGNVGSIITDQPITPPGHFPEMLPSRLRPIPEIQTEEGFFGEPLIRAEEQLAHMQDSRAFRMTLEDLIAECFHRRNLQLMVWVLSFTPWRIWSSTCGYVLRHRDYTLQAEPDLIREHRADVTTDVRKARKVSRPDTDPLGRPLKKPIKGNTILNQEKDQTGA